MFNVGDLSATSVLCEYPGRQPRPFLYSLGKMKHTRCFDNAYSHLLSDTLRIKSYQSWQRLQVGQQISNPF